MNEKSAMTADARAQLRARLLIAIADEERTDEADQCANLDLLREAASLLVEPESPAQLEGPAGGAPAAVDERSTERATAESTGTLCVQCDGNGVIKIPGGISECPTCKGRCWAPAPSEAEQQIVDCGMLMCPYEAKLKAAEQQIADLTRELALQKQFTTNAEREFLSAKARLAVLEAREGALHLTGADYCPACLRTYRRAGHADDCGALAICDDHCTCGKVK